ncbi:MAG: hypothetical protein ACJAR2_004262 [Ilumatobacter sp.]
MRKLSGYDGESQRLGASVVFVGPQVGRVHAVEPSRPVEIGCLPADAPAIDVLVVPGGLGWKQVIDDDRVRSWLQHVEGAAASAIAVGGLTLATEDIRISLIPASLARPWVNGQRWGPAVQMSRRFQ